MNRMDFVHRLGLDNDQTAYQNVNPIDLSEPSPLIDQGHFDFPSDGDIPKSKLRAQGFDVDVFQQSWPAEMSMNFDRSADDVMTQFVLVHRPISKTPSSL